MSLLSMEQLTTLSLLSEHLLSLASSCDRCRHISVFRPIILIVDCVDNNNEEELCMGMTAGDAKRSGWANAEKH